MMQLVSIPDFDSGYLGSSPGIVTNGGISLFGKVPDCESGKQGSIPDFTQILV